MIPWFAALMVRRRARDSILMLAVAFIIVLLATTVMAASPLYSAAVSLAGMRQLLTSAPTNDVTIAVTGRSDAAGYAALDNQVTKVLRNALGPTNGSIVRWGTSESYTFPDQTGGHKLVQFRFAEDIEAHADLISGTWPVSDPRTVQTAVPENVAAELGFQLGDTMSLPNPIDDSHIDVRISGIYQPRQLDDPYWHGDTLMTQGVVQLASFTTYGPFIVSPDTFMEALATRSDPVVWYAVPDVNSLSVGDLSALRDRVAGIADALGNANGSAPPVQVMTKLPELIGAGEQSLLATRTAVLAVSIQMALLALYALVLTAGLLADQRSIEIALLRTRGASVWHIAVFSVVEGLVLTLPSVCIAPLLAAGLLRALNHVGPLTGIGLKVDPSVSGEAYLFAVVAGLSCLLALALPATLISRSVLEARSERGRHRRRNWLLRIGLDLALCAIAGIGYLELRHYHQPVISTVGGQAQVDSLLVSVPGLVLAAGAVLTLRILPLLGKGVELLARRNTRLVPALGAWSVARRPTSVGRTTLLLVLALGIGLFAASYSATWSSSQEDQARFQVGADVRLDRDQGPQAIPELFLSSAYGQLGGVHASMPVQTRTDVLSAQSGSFNIVMLDSAAAPGIVQLRDDLAVSGFTALMEKLTEARPTITGIDVPGQPARIALDLWWTMQPLCIQDTNSTAPVQSPESPLNCRDVALDWFGKQQQWAAPVTPAIMVRDSAGRLFRLTASPMPSNDPDHPNASHRIIFPLRYTLSNNVTLTPQFPISVVAFELDVLSPSFVPRAGEFEVRSISVSDDVEGDAWMAIPSQAIPPSARWKTAVTRITPAAGDSPQASVETRPDSIIARMRFTSGSSHDPTSLQVTISLQPGGPGSLATVPAIANRAMMNADALHVGDTLRVPLGGRDQDIRVVGVVDAFPSIPATEPVLVTDLQTINTLYLAYPGNRIGEPKQEWLSVSPGAAGRVGERLVAPPFRSTDLVSEADRSRALRTDPVILGTIGALSSGFLAAAVFAVSGFLLNIVASARERRTEFALLRALGLSSQQLGGWLLLEHGILLVCGLVLGAGLGLSLVWLVLPLIVLSREATAVFPPLLVVVPWWQVTLLQTSLVATFAVAGFLASLLLRRQGLGRSLRIGGE